MIHRQGRRMRRADRRQILEMVRAGMTDRAISHATTWSESTIYQVRKAAGLRKPDKCGRPIPPDAIARMRELRAAGVRVMEIVAATGYGQSTVRHHTRDCARPRRRMEAPPAVAWSDQPVVVTRTIEDRWREALADRRFSDTIAFDAGRGRVARIAVDHGFGASSMAYA